MCFIYIHILYRVYTCLLSKQILGLEDLSDFTENTNMEGRKEGKGQMPTESARRNETEVQE